MFTLAIWSADADAENPTVPSFSGYTVTDTGWVRKGPEDVPAELWLSVPGIYAVCTVTVDPDPIPPIRKRVEEYARKLASNVCGALVFPAAAEGGEPRTEFFAQRTYDRMTEYSPRVTLCLWFVGGPTARTYRDALLLMLQEGLPYALPASYGTKNPPEFTAKNPTDITEFSSFLRTCDRPVWFPQAPLGNVFLRDNATGEKDKCGYFSLTVPATLYDESPEWREALRRLLLRLCVSYRAFFGQIVRGRPDVAPGVWQGIPAELGEVCVFGGPYRKLFDRAPGEEQIVFSEPDTPEVPREYLSFPKKTLFGQKKSEKRGFALPDDFKAAEVIPPECSAHR